MALERFSPLKSTIPVPSPGLGGSSSSLRLKLLKEAQASIKVPSTVLMIRSAIEVLYGSRFPARALGRVGQGTDEFRVLCVDA